MIPADRDGINLATAAAEYAARGLRVLPLYHPLPGGGCSCGKPCEKSAGKHPRDGKWPKLATSDVATVRKWWTQHPLANIGLALGPQEKGHPPLLAVDVDSAEGEEFLRDMANGDLPPTWEMATGNGRRLLFALPAGAGAKTLPLTGSDGKEAVRFQWAGAQCVMPPSLHYSGRRYEWPPDRSPADIPPAAAPGWLLDLVAPDPDPATVPAADAAPSNPDSPGSDFNRRADWWADVLTPAGFKPAGRRGDVQYVTRPGKAGGVSGTLNYCKTQDGRPAFYLFSGSVAELPAGKSYDPFGALARLNHRGDFKEAAKALAAKGYGTPRTGPKAEPGRATATAGPRPPRQPPPPIPPYRPFPVEMLPERVAKFVRAVAAAVGCDPVFAAIPAIAAVGAAVGTTRAAAPKRRWKVYPCFWAVGVARSGGGKSPPIGVVNEAVHDVEDQIERENADRLAEYLQKLTEYEAKKRDDPTAERPRKPPVARFRVGDATFEALTDILAENPRGLWLSCDEAAGWLASFTRYKAGKGDTDRPRWLSLFDSGSIDLDRKTGDRRTTRVRNALVGVSGGVQPDVLRAAMSAEAVASGLFARVLLAYPPDAPTRWSDADLDNFVMADFTALLVGLRKLEHDRNPAGKPWPHLVPLDPAAAAARKLADLVRRKGGAITARELMRANCRQYPNTGAAEAALDELVSGGYGEWQDHPGRGPGGSSRRIFTLCMTDDNFAETDTPAEEAA